MSHEDDLARALHASGNGFGPDVVVVGLEESESSRRALAWALGLAQRSRASIVAVHVAHDNGASGVLAPERLAALGAPEGFAAWLTVDPNCRALERVQFDQLSIEIAQTAGVEMQLEHLNGEPVDQIVQAVHRHRADLLVIGAPRSRRSVRRSVATRLTHQVLCPVTVVP
jgi:nucleotide-binding universal stress UspA family protein